MTAILDESEKLNLSDTNMVDDLMSNCNALRDRAQKPEAEARRLEAEFDRLKHDVHTDHVLLVNDMRHWQAEAERWKAIAIEERARAIYNKAMAEKKYDLAYGIHEFDEQAARELSAETEIENHIVGADQTVKLSPKAREFLKNYLRDALAGIPHIALTPERREAIKLAMTEVEYEVVTGNFKEEFSEKAEAAVGILRSMLEEAGE